MEIKKSKAGRKRLGLQKATRVQITLPTELFETDYIQELLKKYKLSGTIAKTLVLLELESRK